MKKSLHEELVKAIKENTPPSENPVDFLMSIIPMSKEAAYRRLRGDIQFTLEETAKITQTLRKSLNDLFNSYANNKQTPFFLHPLDEISFNNYSQYYEMINKMVQSFSAVTQEPYSAELYTATTFIPYGFVFRHKMLSKFYLFKRIYQMQKDSLGLQLMDIILPKKIEDVQSEFVRLFANFSLVVIFVDDLFLPIVKDIKFFYNIGLVSENELIIMRDELYSLVELLEKYSNMGVNEKGRSMSFFVSEITFDSSYIYIERSDGYKIFSTNLYGLNFLGSEDTTICNIQKEWIESLTRYANCISRSGGFERTKFFRRQRELIATLVPQVSLEVITSS